MLVVDTSFSMNWFFDDESSPVAEAVFNKLQNSEITVFVPALWVTETVSAFVQGERRNRIRPEKSQLYMRALEDYPIQVVETPIANMGKIAEHARKYNLSGYDAAYLSLAIDLNVPLATLDEKLTLAATAAGVKLVA